MEKSNALKESRVRVLTSSLKSFTMSRFRGANNMAVSIGVASENSLEPRAPVEDKSLTKQSAAVICAAHEHPLFVSEGKQEDVSVVDLKTEPTKTPQQTALTFDGQLPSVDASETSNKLSSLDCRQPSEDNMKRLDNISVDSFPESDLESHKFGTTSIESGFPRELSSTNSTLGSSSSNGLESSSDEFSALTETPQLLLQNNSIKHSCVKTEIPAAVLSGHSTCRSDAAAELIAGKDGVRVPQKTEALKNMGKVFSPLPESARKSKVKQENSGNNLVFTYKKDAEEIGIVKQASEDSVSGSDAEPVDGEADIQSNSNETANSNLQARNKSSSTSEEFKRPSRKKKPVFILNQKYKCRHDEFKRIFRNIPRSDRLIVDYSCALQKHILVQGRLYISQNWICFYACIFGVETTVSIPFKDIIQITKGKTALVFPNAIQISTKDEKHFFGSLNARDKVYLIISYFWKNIISEQQMSQEEMWTWIHYSNGEDLGFNTEDQDYVALSPEEKAKHMNRIEHEAATYQDLEGLGTSAHSKDSVSDDDTLAADSEGTCKNPDLLLSSVPEVSIGEVHCTGHDHFPIGVCDEVLNFSVDKLFDHCFSDSRVFRLFTEIKKTTDIVVFDWPKTPDANGKLVRNLSYILSLNLAMTSKKAPTTEKQIMHPSSKPGQSVLVDSECRTPTIPYGDSFYVVNRYCLTRVTEAKSRLRITSQIVFQKNVFFKSFIEKNATAGILENFKIFVTLLQKESEGKNSADHNLLNHSTLTSEQIVSTDELGENARILEYCAKSLRSPMRLLILALMLMVMMIMLIKVRAYFHGSEINVCSTNQKATYHELIHQLQQQLRQQQTEIEKWKLEQSLMMKTIDELKDRIAYLMQQNHP